MGGRTPRQIGKHHLWELGVFIRREPQVEDYARLLREVTQRRPTPTSAPDLSFMADANEAWPNADPDGNPAVYALKVRHAPDRVKVLVEKRVRWPQRLTRADVNLVPVGAVDPIAVAGELARRRAEIRDLDEYGKDLARDQRQKKDALNDLGPDFPSRAEDPEMDQPYREDEIERQLLELEDDVSFDDPVEDFPDAPDVGDVDDLGISDIEARERQDGDRDSRAASPGLTDEMDIRALERLAMAYRAWQRAQRDAEEAENRSAAAFSEVLDIELETGFDANDLRDVEGEFDPTLGLTVEQTAKITARRASRIEGRAEEVRPAPSVDAATGAETGDGPETCARGSALEVFARRSGVGSVLIALTLLATVGGAAAGVAFALAQALLGTGAP